MNKNKNLLKYDLCKYVNKVIPKYLIVLMNCIDKKEHAFNLVATIGDSYAQERRKFTTTVPSINVKSINSVKKINFENNLVW